MTRYLCTLLALLGMSHQVTLAGCFRRPVFVHRPFVPPIVVKEVIRIVKEPVAVFIDRPFPVIGSFYTGPASAAVYAPTLPPALPAPAYGAAAAAGGGEVREILTIVREISGKVASLEARVTALEARAPSPAPRKEAKAVEKQPAAGEDEPIEKLPDALPIYKASCVACHGAGNEVKGKKFVLIDKDGKRAPMTFANAQAFTAHVVDGTMPPPNNKEGARPLTNVQANALLLDLRNFPRKKE